MTKVKKNKKERKNDEMLEMEIEESVEEVGEIDGFENVLPIIPDGFDKHFKEKKAQQELLQDVSDEKNTSDNELIRKLIDNLEKSKKVSMELQRDNELKEKEIQLYEESMSQATEIIDSLEKELQEEIEKSQKKIEAIELEKVSETLKEAQIFAKNIKENAKNEADKLLSDAKKQADIEARSILEKAKQKAEVELAKATKSKSVYNDAMLSILNIQSDITKFVDKNKKDLPLLKTGFDKQNKKNEDNEIEIEFIEEDKKVKETMKPIVQTNANETFARLNSKLKKYK